MYDDLEQQLAIMDEQASEPVDEEEVSELMRRIKDGRLESDDEAEDSDEPKITDYYENQEQRNGDGKEDLFFATEIDTNFVKQD